MSPSGIGTTKPSFSGTYTLQSRLRRPFIQDIKGGHQTGQAYLGHQTGQAYLMRSHSSNKPDPFDLTPLISDPFD